MDLEKKEKPKKLSIIVIRDGRRLSAPEIASTLAAILMLVVLGVCVAAVAGFFIGRQTYHWTKGETAKIDARQSPSSSREVPAVANADAPKKEAPDAGANTMAVAGFQARFDRKKMAFRIRFELLNRDLNRETATGYVFVALKPQRPGSEDWPTYPKAVFRNESVQNFRDGDPFSIVKKKILKVTISNISLPETYEAAVIYVYASDGSLVLKKNFDLKHAQG